MINDKRYKLIINGIQVLFQCNDYFSLKTRNGFEIYKFFDIFRNRKKM